MLSVFLLWTFVRPSTKTEGTGAGLRAQVPALGRGGSAAARRLVPCQAEIEDACQGIGVPFGSFSA
jgi:hypothetical protein